MANKLETPIRVATKKFRQEQDTRYNPFHTMESPEVTEILHGNFYTNERIDTLLNEIKTDENDMRIVGFSGIGKTRIVCEAFKEINNFNVFYCDCARYLDRFGSLKDGFELLLKEKPSKLTVILDNCSKKLLGEINDIKSIHRAQCRIISLNYDMSEREPNGERLKFYKLNLDFSSSIVENLVSARRLSDEDAKLIQRFSYGLPYMTNLLLNNVFCNGISKIPEDKIYDRILNIDDDNPDNKEKRIVLTSISLFRALGFYEDLEEDMEFVAKNQVFTHWDKSDEYKIVAFRRIEKDYEDRGILERRGNMVAMRPMPVAIHLAGEWYRTLDLKSMDVLYQELMKYKVSVR